MVMTSDSSPLTPARLLLRFLQEKQVRGETHVFLDADRLGALRSLKQPKLPAMARSSPPRVLPPAATEEWTAPQPERVAPVNRAEVESPAHPVQLPVAKYPPVSMPPVTIESSAIDRRDQLASIERQAAACPRCAALPSLRKTMVFAVGNPYADLMFVGEAPGSEEERRGEPFVGPAGQKFNAILKTMGLNRTDVYISNICKYRPAMPNQSSGNRPPSAEEMEVCLPYLQAEIGVVRPKVIVALGATAVRGLLGVVAPMSRMRGKWHDYLGIAVIATYHPSYILHQEGLAADAGMDAKRKVWEDMLMVMEKLEMPVSEKQRCYFLLKP